MDFHNEKRIENQNPGKNMHEWRRWRKGGWHREEKQRFKIHSCQGHDGSEECLHGCPGDVIRAYSCQS